MQISSRFTIGTHVLIMIALQGEKTKVTSDFLAGSVGVNLLLFEEPCLSVESRIDPCSAWTGGAELAKAADEISCWISNQAVECLGSTGQLFGFHDNPNPACPIGHNIHNVLDGKLEDIQTAMEKEMSQTTLKERRGRYAEKNESRIRFIRKRSKK